MAVIRSVSSRRAARRFSLKKGQRWTRPSYPRVKNQLGSFIGTSGTGPNVNAFPQTLTTTLRYCDQYTLSSVSGAAASWSFRMNSVYDPDLTGTGHQPLYYDQITPVYQRYRVLFSKLTVQFLPLSDDTDITTTGPFIVGVTGNSNGTFSTGIATMCEQNNSQTKLMARDKSAQPTTLTLTYTPKKELGIDAMDDTVSADVAGNPSQPFYGAIFAADVNAGGTTTVTAKVTIEFRVQFYEQKFISGS